MRSLASLSALSALLAAAHAHAPPHKLSRLNIAALAAAAPSAGSSISVSPSSGLVDGAWVAVTFSSASPAATDLVLAYAPLPANLSATAPVEWFSPSAVDPAYLSTGSGALPARLVNMRAPYTFVLATGGLARPVAVAVSQPVAFANYDEPRAARLAATGDATEMRISWSSASAAMHPAVEIEVAGLAAGARTGLRALPATSSITWAADDMCGPPATGAGFRDPGFVHSVVVPGLEPGLAYSYTVGDDSQRSQPYDFTQPSPACFPFSISVVGDMGSNSLDGSEVEEAFPPAPNSTRLIAADVASGLSHAVFHVGDISYARGYQAAWEFFLDSIAGANIISPRVPYHVNLGKRVLKFNPSAGPCLAGLTPPRFSLP